MFEKSKILEFFRGFLNIWNILRFVLIVICFVWFLNNAISILKRYFQYNTIVMVEYKQLRVTDLPAFTICAYSFIYDEDLEKDYSLELKLDSKNVCPDDRRNMLREKALKKMTASEIFNKKSITFKSMVYDCKFYSNPKTNTSDAKSCNDTIEIVESINQGKKCFTIFSQLNLTKNSLDTKLEYEMNPYIQIILSNHSEINSFGYLFNETSSFTVHSPNIIPTGLDYKYYPVYYEDSVWYDIRFTKQISYLKPSPYKTNCITYSFDNRPGRRSRGDCFNYCIDEKTFENDCFSYFSIITKDQIEQMNRKDAKICSKNENNYLKFARARRKCLEDCQFTCIEEIVEISYADIYKNSQNKNVIEIRSDSTPYTLVHHTEAMGEPQLIGNLGGHAHIWLGLSALKIFNGIVQLVNRIKRVFFK